MIFFYIPNRFKHSGKSLRCLYLLFRIETIVAIPTIIFMITFSEIMKKYLASAYRRFRIICGLLKQLASDFLLCGCFALHQFVKFLKILVVVKRNATPFTTVSSGSSGFLIIPLETFGYVIMNHKTHIRFVNTHAERNRCHNHIDFLFQKSILILRTGLRIHPRMIRQR